MGVLEPDAVGPGRNTVEIVAAVGVGPHAGSDGGPAARAVGLERLDVDITQHAAILRARHCPGDLAAEDKRGVDVGRRSTRAHSDVVCRFHIRQADNRLVLVVLRDVEAVVHELDVVGAGRQVEVVGAVAACRRVGNLAPPAVALVVGHELIRLDVDACQRAAALRAHRAGDVAVALGSCRRWRRATQE